MITEDVLTKEIEKYNKADEITGLIIELINKQIELNDALKESKEVKEIILRSTATAESLRNLIVKVIV